MSKPLTPERIVNRIRFECRSFEDRHIERGLIANDIRQFVDEQTAALRARLAALEAASGQIYKSLMESHQWIVSEYQLNNAAPLLARNDVAIAHWLKVQGGRRKETTNAPPHDSR